MATEAQDHTNRLNTPHSQKFLVIPSITLFLCAFVAMPSFLYNCKEFFTNQTFYAKRTQFSGKSNERN